MAKRKPKTKQEFIFLESLTWLDLILPVTSLPDKYWALPGAAGDWSLKDVWAHIGDWMKETRRVLPMLLRDEKFPVSLQRFNQEHYEKNRKLTLDAVRRRLELERKRLQTVVRKMPEERLLENRRVYSWISSATYNHYAEHIPAVTRFARSMKRRMQRAAKK
ncbi:MAG TPA: ClbS/DfsB family four-helix bundle protein [Anaerolineae bacterium]